MQVLLVILGLLLYLGIIFLWIKSNHFASKWLLMLVLVVLPSIMYYLVYLKSRGLNPNFIPELKLFTRKPKELEVENQMSVEDAYRILQLPFGASESDVCDAHRRLMVRNHPDNGGSAYIAAMLNQAKSTLTEA